MKDMTLINVVLDRSGSMSSIGQEAVGMFNRFMKEQQELPDYAEMTLAQFDDQFQMDYSRKPIKECQPLELGKTFCPRGMTALYDAIGKTVANVGQELATLPEEDRPARVLCVVLTDGLENHSREYTAEKVKEIIAHQKEKYNWDFIFLASGIDFKDTAQLLNVDLSKCANFAAGAEGIASAGATMSAYSRAYRGTGDTSFTVDSFRR